MKRRNLYKKECLSESRGILRDYKDEKAEFLIAEMTYYWCLLNSNIHDLKIKSRDVFRILHFS